jgi:hypothetical protein|tara:strand:+ start:258 stop:524 length:267 start_codon:yes stop_codon:yes gene_type:complete
MHVLWQRGLYIHMPFHTHTVEARLHVHLAQPCVNLVADRDDEDGQHAKHGDQRHVVHEIGQQPLLVQHARVDMDHHRAGAVHLDVRRA